MKDSKLATSWTLPGALAATVALTALVVLVGVRTYRARAAEKEAERGWTSIPAESLSTRAAQADRLKHYAWIDRQNGVVGLPIERAMTLVVEENAR